MSAKIKTETRAFDEVEQSRMTEIIEEVRKIDETIQTMDNVKGMEKREIKVNDKKEEIRSQEVINNEELREIFEKRVAMNTVVSAEGGIVINEVLSGEIIKQLKDRSTIYSFFDGTTIAGDLKIPKQTGTGTASWVVEGTTPDSTPKATIPTLEILKLGQNRLYRESALTQSMMNVQELDLSSFVKTDIAETMGDAIEVAIFNGSGVDQPTGLIGGIKVANKLTVEVRGVVTIEDLKKCKGKFKKSALIGAKWFMHADTLLLLDLLKDADGRPLLQPDLTKTSDYTILGIPVELTDAIDNTTVTGAKCLIVLASPKAYHTNTQKTIALTVYDDSSYKRAGLVGYGADMYMDGKVKDEQRLAGIFNKA